MPRSSRVPSYRLHAPSEQAVVTLNGRDFYLGPHGSAASRVEYDRLTAEWLANGRQLPGTLNGSDFTIAELLDGYLQFAEAYYGVGGETTSEYTCLKDAVRPLYILYSEHRVADFGPTALKAVRQKMIETGWCRAHINRQVSRVRRVFKWGVENERVPANVLHALQAVAPLRKGRTEARESEPVRPVPDEHVDAVLASVARQVAAMIELQRLAGPRPGEVVILRPCDVDRTGNVWVYVPERHKTQYRDLSREIYLGPKAQDVLRPWLLRDAETYCFSPAEAEAERNAQRRARRQSPMTPSQAKRRPKRKPQRAKRERYDADSYRRAITYATKKAGVPHWSPNQLRHSCATRVRREFGLDVAQIILGHQKCDVTQVYAEADRVRAINAAAKCG